MSHYENFARLFHNLLKHYNYFLTQGSTYLYNSTSVKYLPLKNLVYLAKTKKLIP